MSTSVTPVTTVEIPLTEGGLTELAKILVSSGRMSTTSYRNWAQRTSATCGRWSNAPGRGGGRGGTQRSGRGGRGGRSSNATSAVAADGPVQVIPVQASKKQQKLIDRVNGFKKLIPSCTSESWDGVVAAPDAMRQRWQLQLDFVWSQIGSNTRTAEVRGFLSNLGLTDDEVKASAFYFPKLIRGSGTAATQLVDGGSTVPVANSNDGITIIVAATGLPLSSNATGANTAATASSQGNALATHDADSGIPTTASAVVSGSSAAIGQGINDFLTVQRRQTPSKGAKPVPPTGQPPSIARQPPDPKPNWSGVVAGSGKKN